MPAAGGPCGVPGRPLPFIKLASFEAERGEYRRQLEQLVFAVRDEDGTWDDRVFPRSRSFGTAMALMGLMRPQAAAPATWKAAAP